MRNHKDLRVWDEAHRLTLDIYKTTQSFPKEERSGLTSQVRRASAFNRSESGRRMWPKVGRRDGTIRFDSDGVGLGALLPFASRLRFGLPIEGTVCRSRPPRREGHEDVIGTFGEDRKRFCRIILRQKPRARGQQLTPRNLLRPCHSC